MNNAEKVKLVDQIVNPYFKFDMNDAYGDKGSGLLPSVEEISVLYFKLQMINKTCISKNKQLELVEDIKKLNLGLVEIFTQSPFGRYIKIELNQFI